MLNLFSPVLHSFIQQMFIDLLSVGCCCRCRRYSSEQNRQTFLPSQSSHSNGEAGQRCQMYRKNVQHVRLGFPVALVVKDLTASAGGTRGVG